MLLIGCKGNDTSPEASAPPELSETEETPDETPAEPAEETQAAPEEPEDEPETQEEPETAEEANNEAGTNETTEETPAEEGSTESGVTGSVVGTIITQKQFDPKDVTIKVGDTIKWVSETSAPIVISGPKGTFNIKMYPGDAYSYTFEKTGTFSIIKLVAPIYFQKVHVEE